MPKKRRSVSSHRASTSGVRSCGLGLLGMLMLSTGCFNSGLSSLSGVAAPATRLAPTDPTTLATHRAIHPNGGSTEMRSIDNPAARRESNRPPAQDPSTGLLIAPLPQDLPPVPINREAH